MYRFVPESLHLRFRAGGGEVISPAELAAYRYAARGTEYLRSSVGKRRNRGQMLRSTGLEGGEDRDRTLRRFPLSRAVARWRPNRGRPAAYSRLPRHAEIYRSRSPYNKLIGRCIVVASFFRHDLRPILGDRHGARSPRTISSRSALFPPSPDPPPRFRSVPRNELDHRNSRRLERASLASTHDRTIEFLLGGIRGVVRCSRSGGRNVSPNYLPNDDGFPPSNGIAILCLHATPPADISTEHREPSYRQKSCKMIARIRPRSGASNLSIRRSPHNELIGCYIVDRRATAPLRKYTGELRRAEKARAERKSWLSCGGGKENARQKRRERERETGWNNERK